MFWSNLPQNLMQPFPYPNDVWSFHIKSDQDWPTGLRDIQVWKCGWRWTDNVSLVYVSLVYYKLTFSSGELSPPPPKKKQQQRTDCLYHFSWVLSISQPRLGLTAGNQLTLHIDCLLYTGIDQLRPLIITETFVSIMLFVILQTCLRRYSTGQEMWCFIWRFSW